jgi:hypothetical protein
MRRRKERDSQEHCDLSKEERQRRKEAKKQKNRNKLSHLHRPRKFNNAGVESDGKGKSDDWCGSLEVC